MFQNLTSYAYHPKELSRAELTDQPADTTEFPYAEVIRDVTVKEREREGGKGAQFFYDMDAGPEESQGRDRKGRKRPWQNEGHIQSMVSAPDDVRAEIAKFKEAVAKCFADLGKMVVFFERNYRTQHLQIQAVPIPIPKGKKVNSAFGDFAESRGFELSEIPEDQEIWDMVNEGCPYFCVELPNGDTLFTRQMKQFPIQFGREVLASPGILNMPDRSDWRACAIGKEEETGNTQKFRKKFEKYDFTE